MKVTPDKQQEYYRNRKAKAEADNYPPFNPDLPGWICSACQATTTINYDDKGSDRVAPLCLKCRNQWDAETKAELEAITKKLEIPTEVKLTFDPLTYPFLDEVKKIRDNTTVESPELTALANEYLADKHFEDDEIGIDFINNWIKKSNFKNVTIIFKWIRANKNYNTFRDLIKHEATYRLLECEAPLEYGLSRSEIGLVFIGKLG